MTDDIPVPLCASCKFGHCVQQIVPLDNTPIIPPQEKEEWQIEDEDDAMTPGTTSLPSLMAYSAICWWHPEGEKMEHPIEMMHVRKCSRYELREDCKEKNDDEAVPEEG